MPDLSAMATEAADALSAQAAFFKQKVAKLKARSGKRASELRGKLRSQGLLSTRIAAQSLMQLVFSSWSISADYDRQMRNWQMCAQKHASTATEAFCKQGMQSVLSAWAAAAVTMRHERSLQCHIEAMETRSMTAIAGLRSELRHVRTSRRKVALKGMSRHCQLTLGGAFLQWCRLLDAARSGRQAIAARVQRRDEALFTIDAHLQVSMISVLKVWSAASASSKSEAVLRRELDSAACASTAALGSLRAETRWLRKHRYAQALQAVGAKLRSRAAITFLIWNAEIRSQQARRHLTQALEDADMRHVRAIAVHRASARAARAALRKAGLASAHLRTTSSSKLAFSTWRCAVALGKASAHQNAKRGHLTTAWSGAICQERCHTYLQALLGAWHYGVAQAKHAKVFNKQMIEHGEWLKAAEMRHQAALADVKSQCRALGKAVAEQSRLQIERLFGVFREHHSIQWVLVVFEAWHWTTIRWDQPKTAGSLSGSN
jgi:hypothetical protein